MRKIHSHAAGLDIGSERVYVGLENKEVVSFATFTQDFYELASYLHSHRIETVAMEATGVYWVVLYDILQKEGFDVWLIDGRQTKQVPGRKTDVKDCQWIQQLHSYGLFNRCFVAEGIFKELRSYQRLREDHIRCSGMHINHMQKSLIEMNIRLPEVLSQVHGTSGIAIIEAILSGERDKNILLSLCYSSLVKNKSEQILKALEGVYSPAGIFALKQAYEGYKFYLNQIEACDQQINRLLIEINGTPKSEKKKRKPIRHNAPQVAQLGDHLIKIFSGKDAIQLPGITDYTWLQIYAETGDNLERWPTEKHFTSWLGLAPGQNHSGRKKKSKSKGRPKAGQIFRTIAQSLIQSKTIALGAFGRRIKGRKGPSVAIKATARKLAVQYWRLMVKGHEYVEKGIKDYEEKIKQQKQRHLVRLAEEYNMELIKKSLVSIN